MYVCTRVLSALALHDATFSIFSQCIHLRHQLRGHVRGHALHTYYVYDHEPQFSMNDDKNKDTDSDSDSDSDYGSRNNNKNNNNNSNG
jgi:hypothetical protein